MLLPLLSFGLALGLGGAPQAGAAPSAADDGKSVFGKPLYVNGRRVTDNEIKQWIIYSGPCRPMLDDFKINLIVDEELKHRAQEFAAKRASEVEKDRPFASPEERQKFLTEETARQHAQLVQEFTISQDDMQKEWDRTVADFKRKYPLLDATTEISRAYRAPDWYRVQIEETLRFDRVFLPDDPETWPTVTVQAVINDSGMEMFDDAKVSYEMRKRWQEEQGGDLPPEDTIYAQMLRQIVRDALFSVIDFRTVFDGLPDTEVLTADVDGDHKADLTVTTDAVWKRIAPSVSEEEIRDAKAYCIARYATMDRLAKDGNPPTPEDRAKVMADVRKALEGTYLNLDILAMQTQYFPSPETYLEYQTLITAFGRVMAPKLPPGPNGELNPILRKHYDTKASKIMGLGQVEPEVMLVPAFDIENYRWKPDGWATAEREAKAVLARVHENDERFAKQKKEAQQAAAEGKEYKAENPAEDPYRFWTDLMNDHSGWWDPPMPENSKPPSEVIMKKKGRFGPRYRNDLEMVMLENKYRHWVTGFSITDAVFFDQPEGTVAGPYRATLGYYVTRVNKRTGPSRGLNFADPKHVKLVQDDYIKYEFVTYTADAIKMAEIKGLD